MKSDVICSRWQLRRQPNGNPALHRAWAEGLAKRALDFASVA
jgi:hypothetical protein